ncbi:pyridoxal phosphate-dependent transferase [Syncephalis pseudoplumigaleata]|uniref:Pyridoxal phosphate-dependent transferase n=1 Tax=Syncephalis pseudoplumigaleata TaxID=1712513 RepID=A0A4P9Z6V2_9FUNG|nr:pyridoxal phosphate-dependent transferase [Syncephalis pseudoplumigaleata]|eukprot:RKP27410.1 pyridoxal phosphate-dependent transferase [Syncephalis pseudoplumigaleata]
MTVKANDEQAWGKPMPAANLHAISVSIPTWHDATVIWHGESGICHKFPVGYPRFMLHFRVQQLANECLKQLDLDPHVYGCLPLCSSGLVEQCRAFLDRQWRLQQKKGAVLVDTRNAICTFGQYTVHAIIYPAEDASLAKGFWSKVGCGVSSRFADCCLRAAGIDAYDLPPNGPVDAAALSPASTLPGHYLPAEQAMEAKQLIRRRLVDILHDTYPADAGDHTIEYTRAHPSAQALTIDSVYLYNYGMSAIYAMNRLLYRASPKGRAVCLGFPFTSTLKSLEQLWDHCLFLGYGTEEDIDRLETELADPTRPTIHSLFCEFPTNPLLKAPNIRRLRALADQYDIPLWIDTTAGGFSNCLLLPYVDAMVISLTKLFSGGCDVTGGCLIVNTARSHGRRMQHALSVDGGDGLPAYEDNLWCEDAVVLEHNCRTYVERAARINRTTEAIADYLCTHPKVASLHYPKYTDRALYDAHKSVDGGYGGLLSIVLHTPEAAQAFIDAIPCAKGPTFGTNFTLVCPYTVITHYFEADWAAQYNVPLQLIRIGIGLEDVEQVRGWLDTAFAATPDPPSCAHTTV